MAEGDKKGNYRGEYQAVDLGEDDEENESRAWKCSICQVVQAIESDPCYSCSHPRDAIIPDSTKGHPNEGEIDMTEDDDGEIGDQPEGAPAATASVDVNEEEGIPRNDDADWSGEDDNSQNGWDSDGYIFVDPSKVMIPSKPEEVVPLSQDQGWICGNCSTENYLVNISCTTCGKTRNMREDGIDEIISRCPRVTSAERPNVPPEAKDLVVDHEVWQCGQCRCANDYDPNTLKCFQCKHVVDTVAETFVTFSMTEEEYETLVRKPQQRGNQQAVAAGGGGAGRRYNDGGGSGGGRDAGRKSDNMHGEDMTDNFRTTPPSKYPVMKDLAFTAPNALGQALGPPRALECFSNLKQAFWREGVITFPTIRIREISQEGKNMFGRQGLADRGFDVNEEGNLCVLSGSTLRVYRPRGPSFEIVAQIPFFAMPARSEHPLRVRYRDDIVYVFFMYTIARYRVDILARTINELKPFEDDYMKEQKFWDLDVRDGYIVAVWRKWAGMYGSDAFNWFHAVSTSNIVINPKSLVFKHSYLHVTMGSSLLAFHAASRDAAVLWVNANLPENTDTPFCVSDKYGVFTSVNGNIVQSYYDASTAVPIYGEKCTRPDGTHPVTRVEYEKKPANHLFHSRLGHNPFAHVTHMVYDESFGEAGRLLCYDGKSGTLFMTVNREEFAPLEFRFRSSLVQRMRRIILGGGDFAGENNSAVEDRIVVAPFGMLDLDALAALRLDDRVDYRCADGYYRVGIVRAYGKNGSFVVMGFDDPEIEDLRVENLELNFAKFARLGEVTARPAQRLLDVEVGAEVDVNLDNMGWTIGIVVEIDVLRGQVAVRLGNGELRWTHFDFENEIRQRQNLVGEAVEYDERLLLEDKPTEAGANLMENVTEEEKDMIEEVYKDFCGKYSEPVVKWFLLNAVGLLVESSPFTVTRPHH